MALKLLVSLISRLVACSPRIVPDTQTHRHTDTHTQNDYCNPRCACAPRVNKCSTKPLSKLLTTCLSMVSRHFKQYCNSIYRKIRVNYFWIIDNSQQVLSALSKINYFSTAKHLDSYDFSTLYTSIPHTSLKEALTSLIH